MDFSKMSVDEIITYLFTEAEKGRVFSIDELDKAVEACSIIDRTANADAITINITLEDVMNFELDSVKIRDLILDADITERIM